MNNQPDANKIYLCAKSPYEPKHQRLIEKQQDVGLNILRTPRPSLNTWMLWKMSTRVLSTIQKKRKVLIVFDDMIADVTSNKKIHPVVSDLFIRGWKIDFLLCSFLDMTISKSWRFNKLLLDIHLIFAPKTLCSSEHVLQKIVVFSHWYCSSIRRSITFSKESVESSIDISHGDWWKN